MSRPKCPACPLADDLLPCHAAEHQKLRLCQLAAGGDPLYRRRIVDRSTGAVPEPSLPPVPVMVRNITADFAAAALAGFPQTPSVEEMRRIGICRACDQLRDDDRCSVCGCFLALAAQQALKACPLGKW